MTVFERRSPDDEPDAASLGGPTVVLADTAPSPGAVDRGTFDEISRYSRRPTVPDPRTAAGIMLVLLDNEDPAAEEAFEAWYEGVHVPDVTAAAGFWGAVRYRNAKEDPGPASAGYLAIYVTDNPDVLAEYAGVRAAAPAWVRWHATRRFHVAVYERLG